MVDPSQATPRPPRAVGREDGGQPVREADDRQRDQPEHRAAVGDDQQDGATSRPSRASSRVSAPSKTAAEVGLDRRRSGDLGGDAVGGVRRSLLAQVGSTCVVGVGRSGRGDGDDDERRRAVLRHHHRGLLPSPPGRSALRPARWPDAPSGASSWARVRPVRPPSRRSATAGRCPAGSARPASPGRARPLGGPEHDGDRPSSWGSCSSQLDRQGAVGAAGQRSRAEARHGSPSGTNASTSTARTNGHQRRRTTPYGDRRSARAGAGVWWERHEVSSGR